MANQPSSGSSARSNPRDYNNPFDPPIDPIEMLRYDRTSPLYDRTVSFPDLSESPTPSLRSLSRGAPSGYSPLDAPARAAEPARKSVSAASVTSLGVPLSRYKTDPATQRLVERRAQEIAQWHVHWFTPAMMIALFAGGVLGAVAHHLFYKSLDGKPANEQLKMIRYGTALAFWTKTTLIGSVVLSYRQRIWSTVRKKAMTMSAIDGLFAATDDPTSFLKWEMIRNAKLATLMAAASWLIPIAAVLSPASLTTGISVTQNSTICPSVATLNFTHESIYNFRDETIYSGGSLAFYNTTDVLAGPGYFDYYDQPSKNARRLTITSAFLKKPVSNTDQHIKSCDLGWNCTYTIHFTGPGYKCAEIMNAVDNTTTIHSRDLTTPFNVSDLAPTGTYIYIANVDQGDYKDPQLPTNSKGEPIQSSPLPENLGAFFYEPPLWIGYSINTSDPYPAGSELASRWQNVHIPMVFKCEHYETEYEILMNFTEGVQQALVTNRTFIRPVVNTTIPDDASPNNLTFGPESSFIRPNDDVELYKLTSAYHVMGVLLRNFLRGTVDYSSTYPLTRSDISETRLVDPVTSYPVPNLMNQTQEFYEDMIMTLLSEPHLVVADTASLPCIKERAQNVYHYQATGLWVGYAIVVAIAFVFLIVGGLSMYVNGVSSDTYFSRIMVTTRNSTLDRLSVGACLGGDPFPAELRRTKLRFGVLQEDSDDDDGGGREEGLPRVEHCAFGTVGETKPIVKYGIYAGMKRWRNDRLFDEECEPLLKESEQEQG